MTAAELIKALEQAHPDMKVWLTDGKNAHSIKKVETGLSFTNFGATSGVIITF